MLEQIEQSFMSRAGQGKNGRIRIYNLPSRAVVRQSVFGLVIVGMRWVRW